VTSFFKKWLKSTITLVTLYLGLGAIIWAFVSFAVWDFVDVEYLGVIIRTLIGVCALYAIIETGLDV
jgi:hypothetical protein